MAELRDGGHRALVFSQFTDYLDIVRKMVEGKGWSMQYLDGATPLKERGKRVDAFQNGEGDFFLISLKAGGTGLNLTAADYVIILDPWWNPAVSRDLSRHQQSVHRTHGSSAAAAGMPSSYNGCQYAFHVRYYPYRHR